MKKIFLALVMSAFFMSCAFCNRHNTVVVRNQTSESMEISIWLAHVYWTLLPGQEIYLYTDEKLNILTPFGVAGEYKIEADTTFELHKDGYFYGEEFRHYWAER